MDSKILTAVGYVRVSTEEQKKYGISVDAQVEAITAYCQEHGYVMREIYNDAGISGRKSYQGRPALGRLISDCQDGNVDVIIFTKLDRWTRSVGDYYEIERQLNGIPWVAIQEDYETQTPSGRFKVNIMLSVSQNEADTTAARINATFDYKRARGEPCSGAVPVGYRIVDKHLEFDPDQHDAVAAFFKAYIDTLSLDRAIEVASEHGLEQSRSTADHRLRNPVYRGEASYGSVPAYITQEEWSIIDANMHRKARRSANRTYIFSGLLYCGLCGCRMSGHTQTPGKYASLNAHYAIPGYVCHARCGRKDKQKACSGIYQNEAKLERHLVDNLEHYMAEYNLSVSGGSKPVKNNSAEIRRLEQKISRLKDLYIDGDITKTEYTNRKKAAEDRITELKKIVPMPVAFDLPDGWQSMYWELSADARRLFWKKVIRQIKVFEGHRIVVEF